jgi:hypothetical protein
MAYFLLGELLLPEPRPTPHKVGTAVTKGTGIGTHKCSAEFVFYLPYTDTFCKTKKGMNLKKQ